MIDAGIALPPAGVVPTIGAQPSADDDRTEQDPAARRSCQSSSSHHRQRNRGPVVAGNGHLRRRLLGRRHEGAGRRASQVR